MEEETLKEIERERVKGTETQTKRQTVREGEMTSILALTVQSNKTGFNTNITACKEMKSTT